MNKNRLKEKLSSGGVAVGVFVWEPALQLIEILGLLGFDYLYIDCLHSSMSVETVERIVRTAELRGLTPLVRVQKNVPEIILRYLDVGAMGIQIAELDSAEVARKAVKAVKFAPFGDRGLAGTRAADFGLGEPMSEYVKTANRETMVMGTIECKKGVENISEILAVEGLDGVGIGLTDLSQSLGVPGQRAHPLVQKSIDAVLNAAEKAGKPVAMLVAGGENPRQYIQRGFRLVCKSMNALLSGAARQFLQDARA